MPGNVSDLFRYYRGINILKNRYLTKFLLGSCLFALLSTSHAEQLIMTRTTQTFPEAMSKLQETIISFNYKVSRVQRIDIGLTKSGYATDKYRVVFFGKEKENNLISEKYPHLIPYIPWKIAIFAEQDDTLLVTANPMQLSNKKYPAADKYLLKWKKDIEKFMSIMRKTD